MIDKSNCLKYVSLPIAFAQSLDVVEVLFGAEAPGWVLRMICDCASSQTRDPYYFIPIGSECDYTVLARRCHIPDVEVCKKLIRALKEEGLVRIESIDDRQFFTFGLILEDQARLTEKTRRLREAGRKGARARWGKDEDSSVPDQ